jgi:hypothetical protein
MGLEDDLLSTIFQAIRQEAGRWIKFDHLSQQIMGTTAAEPVIAAICSARSDLFAIHRDVRVKLRLPTHYRPDFDPCRSETIDPSKDGTSGPAFWVYVNNWDVGLPGSGPYRTR